jgi:hypothetical protein
LEEDHQIWDAAVVDISVGMAEQPASLVRIRREILLHVFVNFFLQVDAYSAVAANDLVGANAGVRRNVPARIRNSDISGNVANRMVRALDGGSNQVACELLA